MTSGGKYASLAHVNATLYSLYAEERNTKNAGDAYNATLSQAKKWAVVGVVTTNSGTKDGRFPQSDVRRLTTCVYGSSLVQNIWGGEVSQGDHLFLAVVKQNMSRYATFFIGQGERVDLNFPDRAGAFEDVPQFEALSSPYGRIPWTTRQVHVIPFGVVIQKEEEYQRKRGYFVESVKETRGPITTSAVDSFLDVIITI